MGGSGSGRKWHYDAKNTTNNLWALDIRELNREKLLVPGASIVSRWLRNDEEMASINLKIEEDRIVLSYCRKKNDSEWDVIKYDVLLDWTLCNYGGRRPWFRCPVSGCGRRVAILYGGSIYACRRCHKLVYGSQREDLAGLNRMKADKIRKRLGWEPGILNPTGWKPKGMQWKTFWQLYDKHNDLVQIACNEIVRLYPFFKE